MGQNFSELVKKYLPYEPNIEQQATIRKIEQFLAEPSRAVFILTGYAGTGKTSLMAALVRALRVFGRNTVLMAPTGRAAKVLSKYARKQAFTIHRRIYKPISSKDIFSGFVLAPNKSKNTVFIVDEASMISNQPGGGSKFGSGQLLNDLLDYVYSGPGSKLIVVGDTAQLPPVGLSLSPALDPEFYEMEGFTVYRSHLTQVARQKQTSGVLYNATLLRNLLAEGKTQSPPKLRLNGFKDIHRISGAEVSEALEHVYNKVGIEQTLVITRSNRMANRYNAGIRSRILFREEMLSVDDRVMIVKNNYFWGDKRVFFLANGDIARVSRIYSFRKLYDRSFARVELELEDYEDSIDAIVMLDTLELDAPSLSYEEYKEFFNRVMEDYSDIKSSYQRLIKTKRNEYFNALQIKFAYAVTCHKAQGGQWNTVFIDQTYFSPDRVDTEYFRWLYTALTRATAEVYLVNFADEFFE